MPVCCTISPQKSPQISPLSQLQGWARRRGLAAVGRPVDTDTPEAAAKAVAAAIALHGTLGHSELASLFRPKEAGDNRERALLDYLRARVAAAGDDAALTFEYLGACCAAGQVDELERATRDLHTAT